MRAVMLIAVLVVMLGGGALTVGLVKWLTVPAVDQLTPCTKECLEVSARYASLLEELRGRPDADARLHKLMRRRDKEINAVRAKYGLAPLVPLSAFK